MESLRSMNVANDGGQQHQLQAPSDDCQALSVDSLDLSLDNELNARLLQKCSERDKTRYKIAMIDTSTHSQMQNSDIGGGSALSQQPHHNNNNSVPLNGSHVQLNLKLGERIKNHNPFVSSGSQYETPRGSNMGMSTEALQSPGSLVQMFIQNKIGSN